MDQGFRRSGPIRRRDRGPYGSPAPHPRPPMRRRSLAIGLAGLVMAHAMNSRLHEASSLAKEHIRLLEAVGDPELTVALAGAALTAWHEVGEMTGISASATKSSISRAMTPRWAISFSAHRSRWHSQYAAVRDGVWELPDGDRTTTGRWRWPGRPIR